MRKQGMVLVGVLALALAAGCVTVRTPAPPSPWAGALYPSVRARAEQRPEQGRIYVYRHDDFYRGRNHEVSLDGARIGTSIDQGFFFVDVAPGLHKLTNSAGSESLVVEVAAGEVKYVRARSLVVKFDFALEPAQEAEGDLVGKGLRFALE